MNVHSFSIPAALVVAFLLTSAASNAQYRTVRMDPPGSGPEEVTIAVNPTNTANLIAGANLRYYYVSTDGGDTWTQRRLLPNTYGDPCVTFGPGGRGYYASLSSYFDAIIVRSSTDGSTKTSHRS